MRFDIKPLIGYGPIHFDMTREESRNVLGKPELVRDNRECYPSGLMINFDDVAKHPAPTR